MKKAILPLMIFICNLSAAQVKHQFMLNGTMGYSFNKDDGGPAQLNSFSKKEQLLQLNPSIGFFIAEHFSAGLGIEYLYNKIAFDDFMYHTGTDKGFLVTPCIRYYTGFGPFVHAEFDIGSSGSIYDGDPIAGTSGYTDPSFKYHFRITGFSIGAGYLLKLSEAVGLEPSVKYVNLAYHEDDHHNDVKREGLFALIGLVYFIH
jgi:hypothetical protein